ncbi:MAG TPA: hypothetical protein VII76_14135 [Acidimicrobiales bacterium]
MTDEDPHHPARSVPAPSTAAVFHEITRGWWWHDGRFHLLTTFVEQRRRATMRVRVRWRRRPIGVPCDG